MQNEACVENFKKNFDGEYAGENEIQTVKHFVPKAVFTAVRVLPWSGVPKRES